VSDAERLRRGYRAALAAVNGRTAVRTALATMSAPTRPLQVLAWGKAADAMLQGVAEGWPDTVVQALVITPLEARVAESPDSSPDPTPDARSGASPQRPDEAPPWPFPVRRQPGNHPIPGPESLAAGNAVAEFLIAVPPAHAVLVLLSGGASSLAELLPPEVTPDQLRELNARLLAAGVDIRVMNALRARFSCLKGGRAGAFCSSPNLRVLVISDVPGDDLGAVGSGPFWPAVADKPVEVPDLGWPELKALLRRLPPPPRPTVCPPHQLVARNTDARQAAAAAVAADLPVWDHGLFPPGSAARSAAQLVRFLRQAPAGIHVWGGEALVRLPKRPGRGGRAQHLAALLLLLWLARGWPRSIAVLSAATDGVDGNSGTAGAWFADAQPPVESAAGAGGGEGLRASLRQALRDADTGRFWQDRGQTVPSSGTGTNVMDILLVQLGPAGAAPGAESGSRRTDRDARTGHDVGTKPDEYDQAGPKNRPGPDPGKRTGHAACLSKGVHARALEALRECDPERKCAAVDRLLEAWRRDELQIEPADAPVHPLEVPGRPERPELVPPQALPRRGLNSARGRRALVHAIAHIEFNAINLALDAVYRFRDLPAAFISDWLLVAAEEARHFRMLARRLTELSSAYGAFAAHNGLWEMAVRTDTDALERMALVPRVLEARGLDVTPGMIERLAAAGDAETVRLLQVIQREEIGHVAIGSYWFRHLALERGLDPEATFLELLARHMPGRVRPPFAVDARLAAGFSRRELQALALQAEATAPPETTG